MGTQSFQIRDRLWKVKHKQGDDGGDANVIGIEGVARKILQLLSSKGSRGLCTRPAQDVQAEPL